MELIVLGEFVVLGAVLGTLGTLIGSGGGFLLVPVLLLLGWPHVEAVGTSLLMVAANAVSGSLSYLRQGLVDLASGWRLALATVPGAVLGSLVVDRISGRAFNLVFAGMLLLVAVYLLVGRRGRDQGAAGPPGRPAGWRGWGWVVRDFTDARGERWRYGYARPWALLLSLGVGFLSSVLGIGGGIIHVPALIELFHFPVHVSTATSHFVLAFTAAAGTASNLWLHHVRVVPGIALAIGAMGGAQVGGALARRVSGVWIVRCLALGLLLTSAKLAWSAW